MIRTFDKKQFDETINTSSNPVLVDFWAPWCGPCRMLSPLVDQAAEEYEGRIVVGKINTDENPELCMMLGINSIPALYIFKNGKVADRSVGYVSEEELKTFIDKNI